MAIRRGIAALGRTPNSAASLAFGFPSYELIEVEGSGLMSMLPHKPDFPYRRRILMTAIAVGALVAGVWPGLDIAHRVAAPCALILSVGAIYAFVLGMLKLLSYLPRVVFLTYSYVFFYGGVLSLFMYPFFAASVLAAPSEFLGLSKVLAVSGMIPMSLAAAAAAYVAIEAERDPAAKRAAGDGRNARAVNRGVQPHRSHGRTP
jgi:hypothetical protein